MAREYKPMSIVQIKRKGAWVDWISSLPATAEEHRKRLAATHGDENVRLKPETRIR